MSDSTWNGRPPGDREGWYLMKYHGFVIGELVTYFDGRTWRNLRNGAEWSPSSMARNYTIVSRLIPEAGIADDSLATAVAIFLCAYRTKYTHASTEGIRNNAPLKDAAGLLSLLLSNYSLGQNVGD